MTLTSSNKVILYRHLILYLKGASVFNKRMIGKSASGNGLTAFIKHFSIGKETFLMDKFLQ